ncbi:hypothetical protein G6F45_014313 [Rhizopus arrhizus]|nr:hypothetical protein G6F45_014313 [Rhizopus arrhizus]
MTALRPRPTLSSGVELRPHVGVFFEILDGFSLRLENRHIATLEFVPAMRRTPFAMQTQPPAHECSNKGITQ